MVWSTAIYDTQTGDFMSYVKPSGGEWGRGDVQMRRHTIPLYDDGLTRAQRRDLFTKWDRFLVMLWEGVPVYAGLIINTDYDQDKFALVVDHIALRHLLTRRWMYGIGGYYPSGKIVCDNLSLRGIAARLAYIGLQQPISGAWPVPVTIPAEESGSIDRTYYYYDFQTIDESLSEIESMDGGPDTDLQPRLSGGKLVHDFRIGTPNLTGATSWEFAINADRSPLTNLHELEDGTQQSTGLFAVGKGSEEDMRVGGAALPVSAGLAKDSLHTFKDIDSINQLDDHASADLAVLKAATVQWSANVQVGSVSPALLQIGSTIKTWSEGDPWVSDGWTTHQVIGFSGNYSDTITLQLQEA